MYVKKLCLLDLFICYLLDNNGCFYSEILLPNHCIRHLNKLYMIQSGDFILTITLI